MEAPGFHDSGCTETARLDFCLRLECSWFDSGDRVLTVGWSSGYCAPVEGEAIWMEPGSCPCRPNDLVIIERTTGRIRCGRFPSREEGVLAWVLPEAGKESEDGTYVPWLCAYRPDGHHVYV